MARSREDIVKGLTSRHMLLTADGEFRAPEDVDASVLSGVQRSLLGIEPLSRAGAARSVNRVLADLRLGMPEPAADKGNFRYYPRGVLVRRLLQQWLESYIRTSTAGVEVQTPTLFRW